MGKSSVRGVDGQVYLSLGLEPLNVDSLYFALMSNHNEPVVITPDAELITIYNPAEFPEKVPFRNAGLMKEPGFASFYAEGRGWNYFGPAVQDDDGSISRRKIDNIDEFVGLFRRAIHNPERDAGARYEGIVGMLENDLDQIDNEKPSYFSFLVVNGHTSGMGGALEVSLNDDFLVGVERMEGVNLYLSTQFGSSNGEFRVQERRLRAELSPYHLVARDYSAVDDSDNVIGAWRKMREDRSGFQTVLKKMDQHKNLARLGLDPVDLTLTHNRGAGGAFSIEVEREYFSGQVRNAVEAVRQTVSCRMEKKDRELETIAERAKGVIALNKSVTESNGNTD